MNTATHIDSLIQFIAGQMDGEQLPAHDSPELRRLSEAVAALHQASDSDMSLLGTRTVGIVIDRVLSNLAAEAALHSLSQYGGDRV